MDELVCLLGDRGIIEVGRPMERRRAIVLGPIHIDVLLEQRADGIPILMPRGIDQPKIAGKRHCCNDERQDGPAGDQTFRG